MIFALSTLHICMSLVPGGTAPVCSSAIAHVFMLTTQSIYQTSIFGTAIAIAIATGVRRRRPAPLAWCCRRLRRRKTRPAWPPARPSLLRQPPRPLLRAPWWSTARRRLRRRRLRRRCLHNSCSRCGRANACTRGLQFGIVCFRGHLLLWIDRWVDAQNVEWP